MNRSVLTASAGAAGALALVAAFAGGYAIANGHTIVRTRTITRVVPAPTVTHIRIVYRVKHRKKPPAVAASPAAGSTTVAFGCKVLQEGAGLEFNVTTTGGASYSGTVYVSFYDYAGSGDIFPSTTVQGATPVGSWQAVPTADIGASAEPSGCTASAG